jgi:hypothetical protein
MLSLFIFALALGGALLLLQLLLGLGGLSHDSPDAGHFGHGGHGGHAGHVGHVGHASHGSHGGHSGHGAHGHGAHGQGAHGPAAGLDLLSVRTLAAGTAFFGGAGWAAMSEGAPVALALAVAVVAGLAALVGAPYQMRCRLRLEADGTPVIEGAVGLPGRIYLAVPGNRAGMGKVHLTLQNRTVEYQAVSHDDLPTGADVIVVDVVGPDTVEVVPTPSLHGEVDA